jgi:hypothetical protein
MTYTDDFIDTLRKEAEALLTSLGNRWLHVQGVALRARQIRSAFSANDGARLIAAAYMHDIGYAPALKNTGFHPLDGAYYLRSRGYHDLTPLVAYHSEAQYEARLRGLENALQEFPREQSAIADALTYCDQTIGPVGTPLAFHERIAEVLARYGENDIVSQALQQALPSLVLMIQRTEQRLSLFGKTGNFN